MADAKLGAAEGRFADLIWQNEPLSSSLLAKLAVAASRTGREQVIFSQKDRSRYGKQAVTMANDMLAKKAGPRAAESAGMLTLAEESRPMAGGLILRDGRVETNCSFEVLIHLQRDALSAEVARVLFP